MTALPLTDDQLPHDQPEPGVGAFAQHGLGGLVDLAQTGMGPAPHGGERVGQPDPFDDVGRGDEDVVLA